MPVVQVHDTCLSDHSAHHVGHVGQCGVCFVISLGQFYVALLCVEAVVTVLLTFQALLSANAVQIGLSPVLAMFLLVAIVAFRLHISDAIDARSLIGEPWKASCCLGNHLYTVPLSALEH